MRFLIRMLKAALAIVFLISLANTVNAGPLIKSPCSGLNPDCYTDWELRNPAEDGYKVLLFSRIGADGSPHGNTPFATEQLIKLLNEQAITVVTDESLLSNPGQLNTFNAVIFFNTQRDVLNSSEMRALRLYMQGGGGFVGIHNVFGTQFNWDWFRGLLGNTQLYDHAPFMKGTAVVSNGNDPSTRVLPSRFELEDEWYNVFPNPLDTGNVRLLLEVDDSTRTSTRGFFGHPGIYEGPHPVSWCHYYDGGRAWLTTLGHSEEIFTNNNFLAHVLGGIESAMGRKPFCLSGAPE
ncbi:MAG: ThuA domain-containing protein [Porticoccaceae bacterium]